MKLRGDLIIDLVASDPIKLECKADRRLLQM